MADRGWIAQVAAAAGAAAATGAAQLGLGYGLGVVVWPASATVVDSVWLGSLGWATWIAASSTVFGAVIAVRLRVAARPPQSSGVARAKSAGGARAQSSEGARAQSSGAQSDPLLLTATPAIETTPPTDPAMSTATSPSLTDPAVTGAATGDPSSSGRAWIRSSPRPAAAAGSARPGGPWRFALAASAAVGALLAVALIALPARSAVRPDTFAPQIVAGGYALVGVLLGLVIAYWAVVSRPVAANLIATAAWLWTLAAAAVVIELITHRATATYLTSWPFVHSGDSTGYGVISWPSSVLTLLAALIIGIVAAVPAVRRGDLGTGAASSGAVGPLLVAAAFLVLAPRLPGALGSLESAYLIAPYAVLAGLGGSAITVAVGQWAADRRGRRPTAVRRRRPTKATGVAAVPPASAAGNATGSPEAATAASGRTARGNGPAAGDTSTAEAATNDAAPAPRPRVKGRLRRRGGNPAADEAAVPTGRAKAPAQPPASATGSVPTSPAGPSTRSAPAASGAAAMARPTAPSGRSATSAIASGAATMARPAAPAGLRRGPATPVASQPPPMAPAPVQPAPTAPRPISAPKPTAEPPIVLPTPAASATRSAESEVRSTVAPPPAEPSIAKINPPRPGESATAAPKTGPPRPATANSPSPASDAPTSSAAGKAPATEARPGALTPEDAGSGRLKASRTKNAPAVPAAKKAPTRSARATSAPAANEATTLEAASPLWVDDSDGPAAPAPKRRRFGRRSGPAGDDT